jgi:hypothetical protein
MWPANISIRKNKDFKKMLVYLAYFFNLSGSGPAKFQLLFSLQTKQFILFRLKDAEKLNRQKHLALIFPHRRALKSEE